MMLKIKKLDPCALAPVRATDNSAAYDLYSIYGGNIKPMGKSIIKTGISVQIPTLSEPFKVYGRIASRSGLSAKYGLEVGAGVIDADYDKEICVILHNHSETEYSYNPYERIAQLILEVHITPPIIEVDNLDTVNSNRIGGFGSTGK
jgi:dUTP pyrophosphatase